MGETEAKDAEIERLRDVIKEAEQIVHDSGRLLGEAHQEIERLKRLVMGTVPFEELYAERERCAKVAENYQPKSDPGWLAAKWIAAAIRKGE